MKGKFLMYALIASLLGSAMSWSRFLHSPSSSSGSNWSSRTGSGSGTWGSGTSGGGHK